MRGRICPFIEENNFQLFKNHHFRIFKCMERGAYICHAEFISASLTQARSRNKFGMTGCSLGMTVWQFRDDRLVFRDFYLRQEQVMNVFTAVFFFLCCIVA